MEILKRTQGRTLYIAFNKSIQTETQEKFEKNNLPQGKALTLHALGYSALRAAYTKIELSDSKNWDMIKELEKRLPIYFNLKSGFYKNYEEIMKLKFCLIDMNDVSRSYLEDDPDTIFNIMEGMDKSKFDNDNVDLGLLWSELKVIRDEFEQKRPLVIDFNDMIYLPAKYNIYIPIQPKYLLLDEAQDFNLTQHKLIDNLISQGDIEKWIAVGDRNQCQPKGTKILMRDLTEKNIEDLQIGDEVISYHKEKTQFVGFGKSYNSRGYKVLDKKISSRADTVFTVNLSTGHKSSYTSNHKCYLQFNEEKLKGKYAVYLMRKGKSFRIGISPCYSKFKSNAFGPVIRARAEGADSLWILKVFNTRKEAYLHEQILSYKFKIPQMMFTLKNNSMMTQENLDIFWYEMKDLTANGKNILRWFNRQIEFPLWTNTGNSQGGLGNSWKLSSKAMFKTQACNILPEVMDMCIFDINNKDSKGRVVKKIVSIEFLEVDMKVEEFVSLDIEENHNYVADGILTSNSIYGFSGAYAESFDLFKSKDNTIELPLDICYRCPVLITEEANKVYDVMISFKQEPGVILESSDKKILKEHLNSLVICRNKRQLIQLYFDLLAMDIPSKIMGDDIKGSIIRFLNSYKKYTIKSALEDIDSEIYKLKKKESKTQKQIFLLDSLQENRKILVLLHSNLGIRPNQLVSDLIQGFLSIFENKNSSMTLCTIHKSKGLEADTVVFLNKNLIPHKFAKSQQQLIQERNLLYVALTRAKKNLIYLNLKDYN